MWSASFVGIVSNVWYPCGLLGREQVYSWVLVPGSLRCSCAPLTVNWSAPAAAGCATRMNE